ncbi:hypothetical protein GY45DRAFT_1329850 [Cubamyces sp. BRFM 1775]|nr:hypothetical protein GY45DRAFT_1329850 [Cubamyces sp. BRFM 1775]
MGQGGYLVICNATQYDWKRTDQHSYQMKAWDFPASIPAYTSAAVYVEFDEELVKVPSDDSGDAFYEIDREAFPPLSLKFEFAVTFCNLLVRLLGNGVNAATGTVVPDSVSTSSTGKFEINLGWRHNGNVVFVLGASSDISSREQKPLGPGRLGVWHDGRIGGTNCLLRGRGCAYLSQ